MRFELDAEKSLEVLQKHGLTLEAAQEIFDQAHLLDRKNDNPEQFRAIGWSGGWLCSVIFEIRRDSGGEFYHLITAWRATQKEEEAYAEQIEAVAFRRRDCRDGDSWRGCLEVLYESIHRREAGSPRECGSDPGNAAGTRRACRAPQCQQAGGDQDPLASGFGPADFGSAESGELSDRIGATHATGRPIPDGLALDGLASTF